MSENNSSVEFLYKTCLGRFLLIAIRKTRLNVLAAKYMHTKLSRHLIKSQIKKYNIPMDDFKGQTFNSYQEFFSRKRANETVDLDRNHLISPSDGWMTVFNVSDGVFEIKNSLYRVCDLIPDSSVAARFTDGTCVIVRLAADDYHHYCYIDDAHVYTNNYIEGKLHSVQPIACETYPVFRLNRRVWTVMETQNFGCVVQVEIAAMLVSKMVNEHENTDVKKGEEMGHFELSGSTIALFFEKDKISFLPEFENDIRNKKEIRVRLGGKIGYTK